MNAPHTLISRIHAYVRGERPPVKLPHPDEAIYVPRKEYPRFPRIELPIPGKIIAGLSDILERRASYHAASAAETLPLKELSSLLGNALGMKKDGMLRHYPSGGGLYPVETYLIGEVVKGYPPGVFHYLAAPHVLEYLWPLPEGISVATLLQHPAPKASMLVVFTSIWERSSIKYADLAYSHALIEAGHMAQNVLLCATALHVPARPISGFRDAEVAKLLDVDGVTEQVLYSIALAPEK